MRRINPTDREEAEIEAGNKKEADKRQMGRNARIVNLSVRYLDRKDIGRFIRGVAWNYM